MTSQTIKPSHLPIPGAVAYTGSSRSALYEALKLGKIEARKCGRRTLVSVASLDEYLASLPTFQAGA
ncbi:DNA binding domain-containing protein, excisionase family [Sphingobium faniae]|nr:DNA binding domain-containing protein, excisionase family [Sphingobium faniae]